MSRPVKLVAGRVGEGDLDPAEGVDQVLERAEVDLDVVVDRDVEVQLDGLHQPAGIALVEGRVDPALAVRGADLHPQVAGEREDGGLRLVRVDPQQHDRVGAIADVVALGEEGAGVGRARIDAGPAVRADEEVVLGLDRSAEVDGGRRLAGDVVDARPRQPGRVGAGRVVDDDPAGGRERVVGRPHQTGGRERADDDQAVEGQHAALWPRPAEAAGVTRHGRPR